jgi:AraC-like DNA-binding protein
MTAWTTNTVHPNDGFSFWHEVVGENADDQLFFPGDESFGEDDIAPFGGHVFATLTLSLPCIPGRALRPDMQLAALLAYCQRHLCNPDLTPQMVAVHFGISVRTLHLRFAQLGQTFGRWVLGQRLEACRKALRDPTQRTACISEVAYRCGFNDLSHFNKVFRARFDQTPREWRNGG